jgi:hypothetical protein
VNVVFVLLFPHQLGHFYADGTFQRMSRKALWAMALGGLALLVLLTNPLLFELAGERRFDWFPGIGYYPKSMLGTDTELVSNAYPPTICYLAVGLWTIGLALLVREPLTGWLQRPRPWKAVILGNSVIMTLFLWHMTAYLLAILVLWPLGFGHQTDSGVRWWLERFVWVAAPAVFLAGLVAMFGRFERPRRRSVAQPVR